MIRHMKFDEVIALRTLRRNLRVIIEKICNVECPEKIIPEEVILEPNYFATAAAADTLKLPPFR